MAGPCPPSRPCCSLLPGSQHNFITHTFATTIPCAQEPDTLASTMFRMKFVLLMAVALLATVVVHAQGEIDAGKSGLRGGGKKGRTLLIHAERTTFVANADGRVYDCHLVERAGMCASSKASHRCVPRLTDEPRVCPRKKVPFIPPSTYADHRPHYLRS